MKVLSLPYSSGTNPYLQLINNSLSDKGVEFIFPCSSLTDIKNNINRETITHLHWPSRLYSNSSFYKMKSNVDKFSNIIKHVRDCGGRLVWTVHNILPHEVYHLDLELNARNILIENCSTVIAHCHYAAKNINQTYGTPLSKITIVPHVDLSSAYPIIYSKKVARKKLSLNLNSFIFLSFGKIRNYKGIESLVKAFRKLTNPKLNLIIAGEHSEDFNIKSIAEIINNDSRIITYINNLSPESVTALFSASDVSISNYKSILTSGSCILSMGFSKTTMAPRLGCLPELLSNDRGILYDPDDENSLIEAMQSALSLDLNMLGKNGKEYVSQYSPKMIADIIYSIYKSTI